MSDFGMVAKTSAAFSALGALAGYCVAGPAGAAVAAKVGLATGTQVGMLAKGEEIADRAIDSFATKIDAAVDKTGEAIQRTCDIAGACCVQIADVWSKMALTGYIINFAMGASVQNLRDYNSLCHTAFESIRCFSMNMTTLSLHSLIFCSILALGRQVYHLSNLKGK